MSGDAPVPVLRRLGPDDWATYRAIRLDMLREHPDAFLTTYDDAVAWGEDAWRQRLSGGATLLAEVGGEAVGSVTCWVGVPGTPGRPDGVADLGAMYVAPSARGRGVGEALVRAALHESAAHGRHVVRLEVESGNAPARSLYERIGFVQTGIGEPRRGREDLRDVRMECRLDP